MKETTPRTRILEVASRLFYAQGYNSTGINQIIDEAGIARASLYNHFPSKRDLLTAYLEEAESFWFDGLDKFLEPIKSPRGKILGIFDYRIERQLGSNYGGCQFTKIGAEVPKDDMQAFAQILRQKDRLKSYIKDLVHQADTIKAPPLSKAMLADNLFLMMEGASIVTSVSKDVNALKDARKIAEKLLCI